MILGQSTATAASLAIGLNCTVQEVPYPALKARLIADGQVLDLPKNSKVKVAGIPRNQLKGQVFDDRDAKRLGSWAESTSVAPYVHAGYIHDNNQEKGNLSCVFFTTLNPGTYELRFGYTPHGNRATNVPIMVKRGEVEARFSVNQRRKPELDRVFTKITTLKLDQKEDVWVTVENAGTDGFVVVDAIQWVKK